jgi:hypothetical protein
VGPKPQRIEEKTMEQKLYSIPEAQVYLEHRIGRDNLYRLAHSGKAQVVWIGRNKVFFPKDTLDRILAGEIKIEVKR